MKSIVQKKSNKNDDAVSPVVGVMLMIVITIVIAAVVALFASGLMTNENPAPNTVVGVEASTDSIMLHSISGDELDGSLMKVIISNPDGSGALTTGTINAGGDGKLTMGEFINVFNSVGDAGALSKLMVPGKEIRIQIIYNNNYVVMDRNVIVENGEEVDYYTLNLTDGADSNAQKWYKSENDAVNAILKTTSVPTPEALETITVKKGSVISVTRTGSTDDYDVTPKVINTYALVVNGQPVAWAPVNLAADTIVDKAMSKTVGLYKTNKSDAVGTAKTFTKTGYETIILTDKVTEDLKNGYIKLSQ